MHLRTTIILLLFISILSSNSPLSLSASIDQWCERTPHPYSCIYYFTHSPLPYVQNQSSEFFSFSLQLAIDATNQAKNRLEQLSTNCNNSSSNCVALTDCWKLYDNTELQLNRTLNAQCTHIDSQTWLSAALTNLATCLKGFADIRASDDLINPVVSYNVSDLVSNLLALNKANNGTNATTNYFVKDKKNMRWTKTGHRKLLQVSTSQANFVVAQDGSGNFSTINDFP